MDVNWLRKETSGTTTYYGYSSDVETKNGDKSWSILRISQEVSTERVDWNNNSNMSYISSWNERVECFIAPTGNLGITYSITEGYYYLNLSWNLLLGVDIYQLYITDQNNIFYDYKSREYINNPYTKRITNEINTNNYTFIGEIGMTYSIKVTGVNAMGEISSNITIAT